MNKSGSEQAGITGPDRIATAAPDGIGDRDHNGKRTAGREGKGAEHPRQHSSKRDHKRERIERSERTTTATGSRRNHNTRAHVRARTYARARDSSTVGEMDDDTCEPLRCPLSDRILIRDKTDRDGVIVAHRSTRGRDRRKKQQAREARAHGIRRNVRPRR